MSEPLRGLRGVPAALVCGLIRVWQLVVSPWYGPTCRFYPSCSAYALTAVQVHGVLHGGSLAGRRLLRCNPWNPGGVDHVPPLNRTFARDHDHSDCSVGRRDLPSSIDLQSHVLMTTQNSG